MTNINKDWKTRQNSRLIWASQYQCAPQNWIYVSSTTGRCRPQISKISIFTPPTEKFKFYVLIIFPLL